MIFESIDHWPLKSENIIKYAVSHVGEFYSWLGKQKTPGDWPLAWVWVRHGWVEVEPLVWGLAGRGGRVERSGLHSTSILNHHQVPPILIFVLVTLSQHSCWKIDLLYLSYPRWLYLWYSPIAILALKGSLVVAGLMGLPPVWLVRHWVLWLGIAVMTFAFDAGSMAVGRMPIWLAMLAFWWETSRLIVLLSFDGPFPDKFRQKRKGMDFLECWVLLRIHYLAHSVHVVRL